MTLQAKKESNDSSPLARSLTLEHVDPRNHHLVCGLKNEFNEILADYSYNSRKTDRFVPYRVCDFPAPVTFGDIGEFLIQNHWVTCEFGGETWWEETNRIGNSQTRGGQASTPKQYKARSKQAQKMSEINESNGIAKKAREKAWESNRNCVIVEINDETYVFRSQKDMSKAFNLCPSHLQQVLDGKRKSHKGFTRDNVKRRNEGMKTN